MKHIILTLSLFVMSFSLYAEHQSSVYLKLGSFTMAKKSQAVTFDTTSTSVFSLEYERKMRNNMSWGGELISYQNDYASGSGYAESTHVMFNFRKNFVVTKHFQPFMGVGIGASSATLGGVGSGSAGGLGLQVMAGIRIPFEEVTMIAEYKIISAKPDDEFGNSVDISGRGLFFGVGMNF